MGLDRPTSRSPQRFCKTLDISRLPMQSTFTSLPKMRVLAFAVTASLALGGYKFGAWGMDGLSVSEALFDGGLGQRRGAQLVIISSVLGLISPLCLLPTRRVVIDEQGVWDRDLGRRSQGARWETILRAEATHASVNLHTPDSIVRIGFGLWQAEAIFAEIERRLYKVGVTTPPLSRSWRFGGSSQRL